MVMTASSGAPERSGTAEGERSPFLRTAELLAPYQPGKPLITLSLGEPQHPVPGFVGPVLAAHIADFGRYPIAKGIEPFRRAAANWLSRRFKLPRALDPETELLVLSGSREGLFQAPRPRVSGRVFAPAVARHARRRRILAQSSPCNATH